VLPGHISVQTRRPFSLKPSSPTLAKAVLQKLHHLMQFRRTRRLITACAASRSPERVCWDFCLKFNAPFAAKTLPQQALAKLQIAQEKVR
jgi:hypothetical protein